MTPELAGSRRLAVALVYDDTTAAPRVTAKGKGYIADEILRLAKENKIPIREEPELVNLLAQLKLDQEIPPALYVAVAEVIAFAFMLRKKLPTT